MLQVSQKTIMLLEGPWPRPQFMHTAAAPGARLRFLGKGGSRRGVEVAEGRLKIPVGGARGRGGWVICVILRPERDWVGREISSLAEVLSASSSVSPRAFLRRLFARVELEAVRPARLPRGRPPRFTPRAEVEPARLPRGRPPRFMERAWVGWVIERVGVGSPEGASILILGRPWPRPRRPPVFIPPRVRLGAGLASRS